MQALLTFDQLWDKANTAKQGGNVLFYHPCCDVWTTRSSKAARNSHSKYMQWGKLILTLEKNIEDKKQALQAKMIEEGWRLPALLNEPCKCHLRITPDPNLPFKPHNPDQRPEELRPALPPQGFIDPLPIHFAFQDPGT